MEINLFEGMEYIVYKSKDIHRHYDYLESLDPGHCYIVVEIYKNRVKERTEIKGPCPDVLADEVISEIKGKFSDFADNAANNIKQMFEQMETKRMIERMQKEIRNTPLTILDDSSGHKDE